MGKNLNVPKHIASGPGERVETTVLKRRKRIERVHAEKVRRGQAHKEAAAKKKTLRKKIFRNARDFVNNYKRREAEVKELARRNRVHTRKPLQLPKTHEGQMALVIRVKGHDIPEVSKRLLKRWRLNKMYEGAFITVNRESLQTLHLLKDFVKWGYPTLEQVGVLLRTRAYTTNEDGMRIPIIGNAVIEEKLGSANILCIEDMEHAIANHTEQFQAVVDFLAPFHLDPPTGDDSEQLRRTREKRTTAGEGTFATYLLNAMPDLPAPAQPQHSRKRKADDISSSPAAAPAAAAPAAKKAKTAASPKASPKSVPKAAASPKASPAAAAATPAKKRVVKKKAVSKK